MLLGVNVLFDPPNYGAPDSPTPPIDWQLEVDHCAGQ